MTVAVYTLGCKVNQCDADALISALASRGHNAFSARDLDLPADIFVINTCTVTHISDKKSRQMISRAKNKNPGAFIAISGCMAKNNAKINGVDFIFDARHPEDFFSRIEKITPQAFYLKETSEKIKTRSFIKIQDGCDRFCSYCIVPYVRGEVLSRPVAEVVAEAEKKIACGAKEIVLTGIQVASYGKNEEASLSFLIKKIAALNGRLRLSSIDPWAVDENFLEAVSGSPSLCCHFHLSLQSGCDATLKRMNRRYTTADYAAAAHSLRKINPETALTTDIIVGFPGESDEDFEKSCAFVREMNFAKIHVFEFSAREGTPAANFSQQISSDVKKFRGKIMRQLANVSQKNFLQNQIGKILNVLFETNATGFSENYCKVKISSDKNFRNTIQRVKITACTNDFLTGKIL
jgi:threonylcarbamoyladenosine tRNA methylthiotransferase MtaB